VIDLRAKVRDLNAELDVVRRRSRIGADERISAKHEM
jgi:hypothetical protein